MNCEYKDKGKFKPCRKKAVVVLNRGYSYFLCEKHNTEVEK